jgi:hypothetical protein
MPPEITTINDEGPVQIAVGQRFVILILVVVELVPYVGVHVKVTPPILQTGEDDESCITLPVGKVIRSEAPCGILFSTVKVRV